jgi:hypothetical protein
MANGGRGLRDPDDAASARRVATHRAMLGGAAHRMEGTADSPRVRWALDITDRINNTAVELHRLLYEAKQNGAHTELGFGSWQDYVQACFRFSRQYADYQIKHAQVIEVLERVAGITVTVPEGQTRGMAKPKVLDAVTEYMTGEIERGVDPELVVQRVIAWWGQPNRKQALAMARVPGALTAMSYELAVTDDFAEHVETVRAAIQLAKRAVPSEDFVERLTAPERQQLDVLLAQVDKVLAPLRGAASSDARVLPAASPRRQPPPAIKVRRTKAT